MGRFGIAGYIGQPAHDAFGQKLFGTAHRKVLYRHVFDRHQCWFGQRC